MKTENSIDKDALEGYFTSEKKEGFWRTNGECYRPFCVNKPRVPFTIVFVEDWIKGEMGVKDNFRYYTDVEYQQLVREECSIKTTESLGIPLTRFINMGSTIFASIFGGRILYRENSSPWIEPIIKDPSDVKNLFDIMRVKHILDCGQVKQWVEGYKIFSDSNGDDCRIYFGSYFHGMATIGCMLAGATNFLYMMADYPEETNLLMEIITEVAIKFMDEMRCLTGESETGLILANDDLGLLSPELYERFCLVPELRLFNYYSHSPSDMRGYHSDSSCSHLFELLKKLNLTDINLSPFTPLEELRKTFPDVVIHGQIPPLFFRNASIAEVVDCIRNTIKAAGSDGGLVLSIVGCLNEGTPVDNILAAMWAVEQYGRYSNNNSAKDMTNCNKPRELTQGMPMGLEVE